MHRHTRPSHAIDPLMKKYSHLLLILLVVLSSCSKKEDPAPTQTQLLSQNTWILGSLTSSDPDIQSSGQILLGSEWSFKSDKSFLLYISVNGVNLSFPGTWSISSDEKTITLTTNMSGTPATTQMTIITLTASALHLKEIYNGITSEYTFTKKP